MSQTILNQIIEQLQMLETSELQQLSQVIQDCLIVKTENTKYDAFHQALLTSGLVRQTKKPRSERIDQPLVECLGKPVSETIIDERR